MDVDRQTGRIVGVDHHRTECCFALGRFHAGRRHLACESLDGDFLLVANDGIVVAAHAEISHVTCPAGEYLGVRRRNMRVGADDNRDPPVEEMPHRHFLARCLAMKI